MMLKRQELLKLVHVDDATLESWIVEQWLMPVRDAQDDAFCEADVARARLIVDLIEHMGVNRAGVGVALHLIDQLHGARQALALHRRRGAR